MERIFVGVAWPYVNGPQHVGHLAGNILPADIFARYQRLAGREVLMVSGSDMHGTPTAVRAEEEKVPPEEIAFRFHAVDAESFRRLGISFDLYTHTHTEMHFRTAQGIFLTLLQEGYLEKRTTEATYCPHHARFLPDRYTVGTCPHCGNPEARGDQCDVCSRLLEPRELKEPRCRLCGTPAEFRTTEHFYFLLPKLEEPLREYHRRVAEHWRPSVRKFTENFVAQGLEPRPITRDIDWGIPLPLEGYAGKRLYVWFEAVIGYLSASKEWATRTGDPERWKRFWDPSAPVRMYNFQGKDNITFHTIFWPAILLGVGNLALPYDVPANEFLNIRGGKISKSRTGEEVPVYLPDLLERFDPDLIRFYAAYHMPQNHDTEFDFDEFRQENDQILADQWGNLVQRVVSFARSRYDGKVPEPPRGWKAEESPLRARIARTHQEMSLHLEEARFKEPLDLALALVREANRAFHEGKPWASPEPDRSRMVFEGLYAVRSLAILLGPFLPFSSQRVADLLGEPDLLAPGNWRKALEPPEPGRPLGEGPPLFAKLLTEDHPSASAPAAQRGPSAKASEGGRAAGPHPPEGSVAPALDVVVGRVVDVQDHPKADKLYVLSIDLGEGSPRTVVAGIKPFLRPEEIRGKAIAVLANMAPRPLRGVTSQGMVLAAEHGAELALLVPPEGTLPGTRLAGAAKGMASITADEFARARLVVASVLPPATDATVRVDAGKGPVPAPVLLPAPSAVIVRLDRQGEESPEPLRLEGGGYLSPSRPLPPGARVR